MTSKIVIVIGWLTVALNGWLSVQRLKIKHACANTAFYLCHAASILWTCPGKMMRKHDMLIIDLHRMLAA